MYRYEMPWTCCGCIMLRHAASMSIIVYHVYLPESLRNLHCSCHWATGPLGVMFRGFASFRCAPGLLGLRRLGHLDGLLPPVLVWIPAKIWWGHGGRKAQLCTSASFYSFYVDSSWFIGIHCIHFIVSNVPSHTHTDHHHSLLIPNQHDRTRCPDLDEASHFDITILSFPLSSPSPVQGQWHGRTEFFKFHSRQTGVAIALERCSKGLVYSIIILTWCFRKSFRGAFATTLLAFAQWTFDRTAFAELSRRSLSIWSSPSFRPTFTSWVLAFAGTTQFKPE